MAATLGTDDLCSLYRCMVTIRAFDARIRKGLAAGEFAFSYWRRDGWFDTLIQGTAYAVRPPGNDLFVLSNICTHLGCPLRWSGDVRRFLCPCHRGVFDTQGNAVSGPPPRPLDRYAHRIAEGIIQIQVARG